MTAQLAPSVVFRSWNNLGLPLVGGKLFTYMAGTTAPQATYVDSTQTTPNTNPVILNFRGEAFVWLDPTLIYKFVLQDFLGNLIWTEDNIPGGFGASGFSISLIPNPTNTYSLGDSTHSWTNVYLGPNAAPAFDPVSGNIGYYARTAAEIAAGVTPTNFVYAQGDARRYGADPTNVVDSTAAIQRLFNVCQQGFTAYFPGGVYKISGPLTWNGAGAIYMEGATDSVSCLSCTGSGYTALTFGSSSAVILKGCTLALQGNGNTINGVKAGTSGSAGHNLESCLINAIRVNGFNGFGLQINDCWDSTWEWISVQLCGTGTGVNAALSINNLTDTSNQNSFVRVQSEQGNVQAIFVDQVLNCFFGSIHCERAVGNGTDPTHVFGGAGSNYSDFYLAGATNGLVLLNGASTIYGPMNAGCPVQFSDGNSGGFGASNQVNGLGCTTLTELGSNIYGWNFKNCSASGTFTYQSGVGLGKLRFESCSFANIAPTNNGSTAQFIDCAMSGTWTVTGSPVVLIQGGIWANFPPTATVQADNATFTAAYTTQFNQQIQATRCVFSGTLTLSNNGVNWRSDACMFASVTVGAGAPGFLFGPRDRATGTVSAGLLQNPSAFGTGGVAYVLGDKGYNLQAPASGSFAWTCTTAGSPGTFTNLTLP